MNSGFYAACTALIERTNALDAIANNLANASTTGFRGEMQSFSAVMAGSGAEPQNLLNQATNSYGVLGESQLDRSQGSLVKTGNPLDVAIAGPGFFSVRTPSGTEYTRDGAFQVSASGQLVTANGDAVLGQSGAIQVPSGPVTISKDGTVSANGAIVDRLAVVEFSPATQLNSAGRTNYTAPAGSATAATGSAVEQGTLESSNVNPITSVVQLINAQRSAEQVRHMLTMFDSEMNKTAAQDLPRVS